MRIDRDLLGWGVFFLVAGGAIAAGLVLIVLGSRFLARAVAPELDLGRVWPVASVILGVALGALSIRPARPVR